MFEMGMESFFSGLYRHAVHVPGVRRVKRILTGESGVFSRYVPPVGRPADRAGAPNTWTPEALQRRYEAAGLDSEPDTFMLYRIIGNDLAPRHRKGQSAENLAFILENEPVPEGCEKRFVVNRIVDGEAEAGIIRMLEEAGMGYIRIPFEWEAYQRVGWDEKSIPGRYAPGSKEFDRLDLRQQERILMAYYRLKNNYAINNNGARDAALRDGKARAKWVMPWDGNCFITEKGWAEIRNPGGGPSAAGSALLPGSHGAHSGQPGASRVGIPARGRG